MWGHTVHTGGYLNRGGLYNTAVVEPPSTPLASSPNFQGFPAENGAIYPHFRGTHQLWETRVTAPIWQMPQKRGLNTPANKLGPRAITPWANPNTGLPLGPTTATPESIQIYTKVTKGYNSHTHYTNYRTPLHRPIQRVQHTCKQTVLLEGGRINHTQGTDTKYTQPRTEAKGAVPSGPYCPGGGRPNGIVPDSGVWKGMITGRGMCGRTSACGIVLAVVFLFYVSWLFSGWLFADCAGGGMCGGMWNLTCDGIEVDCVCGAFGEGQQHWRHAGQIVPSLHGGGGQGAIGHRPRGLCAVVR